LISRETGLEKRACLQHWFSRRPSRHHGTPPISKAACGGKEALRAVFFGMTEVVA
jgi:hypothetical protein